MPEIKNLSNSTPDGRVDKPLPRMLIVDTPGPMLSRMMEASDTIRKMFHCEPVFAVYNPNLLPVEREKQTRVHRHDFTIIDSIADFAKDPDNHIDMVLTGRSTDSETYGLTLSKLLKKTAEPFKGHVAIQGALHDNIAEALNVGAIGAYEKADFLTKETSAVTGLMEAHAKAQGRAVG